MRQTKIKQDVKIIDGNQLVGQRLLKKRPIASNMHQSNRRLTRFNGYRQGNENKSPS